MEKSSLFVLSLVFTFFPNCVHGIGDIPTEDFIARELYCIGCEYTIKALYGLMQRNTAKMSEEENLDKQVKTALESVCSVENYEGAEYSPKEIVKACKFLIKENGEVLKRLLTGHFAEDQSGTYLDLSQQVCIDLSKACVGVPGEKRFPDHLDSDLEFDKATNTFRVKEGRNIRMPDPVRAKEDL